MIEPACHVFGQSKICPLHLQKALDFWESFHSHCFVTATQLGFRVPFSNSNFFHLLSPTPRSPVPLVTCLDVSGCGPRSVCGRFATACAFSTSQLPKVVRAWCVLCVLTWKCASRLNGVQLFISHLTTWLRTRLFSEPTFRPSGATNHWKNTVNRDFPIFFRASTSSFF